MKQYQYQIYGTAFELFPIETHYGLFALADETTLEIPQQYPFCGPWGELSVDNITTREEKPLPISFEVLYLSVIEENYYYIEMPLGSHILGKLCEDFLDKTDSESFNIVLGMAPYGKVSLWVGNGEKQILLGWLKSSTIQIPFNEFLPERIDITLGQYCQSYIDNDSRVKENLEKNGLPPRDLFDRYMQQFNYRYVVEFGHWDEEKKEWKDYESDEVRPKFEYIEEALYDGTHDKLHDGGLMQYHPAGKPKKLALQYHIKKSVYSAYLWFEDLKIRAAFENFYREYPEAEMDFLFRIDPEKNIYQILFTCKDAEQPVPLHEEAYQMIVFKSKFERYRTKNYNQPRGAWIW